MPLDGSAISECVLPHAEKIAGGCGTALITLLRICEPPVILADYPPVLGHGWEDHVKQETAHLQQQCRSYLEKTQKRLEKTGIQVIAETRLGKPAEQILRFAEENQIDIIIMASHGHAGITRWAYGSTAGKVIQASSVPVLLVKPRSQSGTGW